MSMGERQIGAGAAYAKRVRSDPALPVQVDEFAAMLAAAAEPLRWIEAQHRAVHDIAQKALREVFSELRPVEIPCTPEGIRKQFSGNAEVLQAAADLEAARRKSAAALEARAARIHQCFEGLRQCRDVSSIRPPDFDGTDCFKRPLDEQQIRDAIQEAQADRESPKPKAGRMKRSVAEPQIAQHLRRRPHDTAEEVAEEVGCSIGVVAESKAWALNQFRLRTSKKVGIDPAAVRLDERAVNHAGGSAAAQIRRAREEEAHVHGTLDEDDRTMETYGRIGEYERQHPKASLSEIAEAAGCTISEVQAHRTLLEQLVSEQVEDQREDEPPLGRDKRQQWVPKRA